MVEKRELIGSYYVRLLESHINFGNNDPKRAKKRKDEAYLPIPAQYAYAYKIKHDEFQCRFNNTGEEVVLKATGTQSKREYAKNLHGSGNLKILYDWYKIWDAEPGDYVIVKVFTNNYLELIPIKQKQKDLIKKYKITGIKGKIDFEKVKLLNPRQFIKESCRLIDLKVSNNSSLIFDYNFFSDKYRDNTEDPVVTLIIGVNGAGKSRALGIITEIFGALQSESIRRNLAYDKYILRYNIGGNLFEVQIIDRQIIIHRNNELLDVDALNSEKSSFPNKVLALSFMVNDKFIFNPVQDSRYVYLGMRATSNALWVSTLNNKVAEYILNLANCQKLWPIMHAIAEYLDICAKVKISFEFHNKIVSIDEIKYYTKSNWLDMLKKRAIELEEQNTYRKDSIKRLSKSDYEELAAFLWNTLHGKNYTQLDFIIEETSNKQEIDIVQEKYRLIKLLRDFEFVKNISLSLMKNNEWFSFDDASSGEKNIFYSVFAIENNIENNSVILIDEPEISLHPNWQMKYIGFLKKLFRKYSSCHFIIATHSPYLVSDLDINSSSLVLADIENGKHISQNIDYSTYAWSVENILYNVFKVRTIGNAYFEMDLREIISYIREDNKERLPRIKELYEKLSKYTFCKNDPLLKILDEVKEYIQKNA
ncbi:MAG: ATP-binding protein [Holdemanella biformis]|nr:ATP-binding protein [Holdemanella biformis]